MNDHLCPKSLIIDIQIKMYKKNFGIYFRAVQNWVNSVNFVILYSKHQKLLNQNVFQNIFKVKAVQNRPQNIWKVRQFYICLFICIKWTSYGYGLCREKPTPPPPGAGHSPSTIWGIFCKVAMKSQKLLHGLNSIWMQKRQPQIFKNRLASKTQHKKSAA